MPRWRERIAPGRCAWLSSIPRATLISMPGFSQARVAWTSSASPNGSKATLTNRPPSVNEVVPARGSPRGFLANHERVTSRSPRRISRDDDAVPAVGGTPEDDTSVEHAAGVVVLGKLLALSVFQSEV